MGMDVYGRAPKSETGGYFRNGIGCWHPLATYICHVAPQIADKCKGWHHNDGDGLGAEDSAALAEILQKEIDSGRTETYRLRRQSYIESLPNEPCWICDGTGTRKPLPVYHPSDDDDEITKIFGPPAELGAGDPTKGGIVCNCCKGKGYVPPGLSEYAFDVENVAKFAAFLKDCGGFSIC